MDLELCKFAYRNNISVIISKTNAQYCMDDMFLEHPEQFKNLKRYKLITDYTDLDQCISPCNFTLIITKQQENEFGSKIENEIINPTLNGWNFVQMDIVELYSILKNNERKSKMYSELRDNEQVYIEESQDYEYRRNAYYDYNYWIKTKMYSEYKVFKKINNGDSR